MAPFPLSKLSVFRSRFQEILNIIKEVPETSIKTEISPVIDLYSSQSVPYGSWKYGFAGADGDIIIPKKVGFRFCVKQIVISGYNTAVTTGAALGIGATIGGTVYGVNGPFLAYVLSTPSAVGTYNYNTACDIMVDPNTEIKASVVGAYSIMVIFVNGYYVPVEVMN